MDINDIIQKMIDTKDDVEKIDIIKEFKEFEDKRNKDYEEKINELKLKNEELALKNDELKTKYIDTFFNRTRTENPIDNSKPDYYSQNDGQNNEPNQKIISVDEVIKKYNSGGYKKHG